MPVFWESFVPTMEKVWSRATPDQLKGMINSFPYERWEVEQTLFQFQDAAGGLIHYQKKSKFRKCSCVHNNGNTRECSSKHTNWQCERPALLLRKNILIESIMVEKRRKQKQEKRIDDAVETAKKIAIQYLHSDEGKEEVRYVAEHKVKKKKEGKGGVTLLETPQVKHTRVGEAFHPSNKNTNVINIMMDYLPWKKRIQKEMEIAMAAVRNDFISKEIDGRRKKAIETNEKLKMVLDAWLGLTIEDVFIAWKNIVNKLRIQRIKDDDKRKEEKERHDLEEKEQQIMALEEVSERKLCILIFIS